MKNKNLILIISVIVVVVSISIFVIPVVTNKAETYVGVFKEPYPNIFGSDTIYIIPLIIENCLTKKVIVKNFIIDEDPKQTSEIYNFIKDNLGQKCFVTVKKTTIHGYAGSIKQIVIK